MRQDDFRGQSIPLHFCRPAHCARILVIALMLRLSAFCYAQEAGFISFIFDTDADNAIICSADGRNVYACGVNSIAVFQRRDDIDTLEAIQVLNNDHQGVRDVHNVTDLALAPDGRYLYGVCQNQQTLLLFARDTTTGKIALRQVIQDSVFGRQRGAVPFVERNHKLLISPDGRHLYWFYSGIGIVSTFARDVESGEIEKVQVLRNGVPELGGFNVPAWIAISSDGKHLYGGGNNGTKMVIFGRNLNSGKITYQDLYDTGPTPDGRWERGSITASPDGVNIYVINLSVGKLFVFARNEVHGELESRQTINHNSPENLVTSPDGSHIYFIHYDNASYFALYQRDDSTDQLAVVDDHLLKIDYYLSDQPSRICISPNGDAIYMIDGQSRHSVFKRDTSTGVLLLAQQFKNNIGGTDRLHGSRTVAVSPEGKFLYVAANDGREDIGISVFSRDQANGQITLSEIYPLDYFGTIVLPADGKHLYVTKAENLPLEVFARDEQSGSLRRQEPQGDSSGASFVHPALFSANGKHLYANSLWDMTVFQREPMNGQLTRVQRINCQDYDLGEVFGLAISPDDSFLYRYSFDLPIEGFQIATFARDPASGQLRFLHKIENGYLPGFYLGPVPPPASTIIISPDGRHVYVAATEPHINAYYDATLCAYSRNPATGELTFVQALRFGDWWEMRDLGISLDGSEVYALMSSGGSSSELAILDRDANTGRLTVNKRFASWKEGVYGMFSSWDLTLSPDGRFIYIADTGGLATFATGRGSTSVITDKNPPATLPHTLTLEQNYPNPFSSLSTSATLGASTTTIRYEIPVASQQTVPVELAIYNLHGQLVRTLVNELKIGGRYSAAWNAFDAHGKPVPSGLYFYRLKSGDSIITRRLLLIK